MALAIFDLDNTLIAGDSDHEWGQFMADQGLVDAATHRERNDRFYGQYLAGTLDMQEYLRFACGVLAGQDADRLRAARREFMQTRIEPMLLPRAQALVASHVEAGDYPMVITSTLDFVVEPIVQRFGIDTLIASVAEYQGGAFTGGFVGTPSFGAGKVTRLREWLEGQGGEHSLAGSHFYSDSHNDLPLLEVVDNPVAVDPDDQLRQVALDKGWRVISLRD